MTGLYIHIPFCRTRCPYCDFASNAVPGAVPSEFVDALCREIAGFSGPGDANTVFFGGGTPSLLDPPSLEQILASVRDRFVLEDPEVTIEANPDDVTPDLVDAWRGLGVTRASLGVQSFDDRVLQYLGRRHDARRARQACEIIASRFANWGMDLIFGASPVDAWDATLETCLSFSPAHVSTYGLTYEPGTAFEDRSADAAGEDVWLALYRHAHARLARYDRYEISNHALPGFYCRHNLIYWHNTEYAGFGPAAYSFLGNVRARNCVGLKDYLAEPGRKSEALELTRHEVQMETVIQHLRLRTGLPKAYYRGRFGSEVRDDFGPQLEQLCVRGLIEEDADTFFPTAAGFELNNEIGLTLVD